MDHLILDTALTVLAGLLSFISGIFNALMEISTVSRLFRQSKISHWNAEFWEFFGIGQAWRNSFENRDPYTKKRKAWVIGKYRITKPICFLNGFNLSKLFWRVFIALSVIPIAIVCHTVDGAIWCSALLYFPQFAGFYSTTRFLVKKS